MTDSRSVSKNLNIIGIKVPEWISYTSDITAYKKNKHQNLILSYLSKVIQHIPNNPNQINFVVLPENAFTPFVTTSKERDFILDTLQVELLKRSDQEIYLVTSFNHVRVRKMDDKTRTRIRENLSYHREILTMLTENDLTKLYSEQEIKHIEDILESNKTEIFGQENTAYILCSSSAWNQNKGRYKRNKSEDHREKERFNIEDKAHARMKEEAVFLLGADSSNLTQILTLKNGDPLTVSVVNCYERSTPLLNRAYNQLKNNPPNIQILISDHLPHKFFTEKNYGDVFIHMDSLDGLYIKNNKISEYVSSQVLHDLKNDEVIISIITQDQNTVSLHEAILNNKTINEIKELLENQADVNGYDKKNNTPLVYAIRMRNLDIFKLLITYGAKIHSLNESSISYVRIAAACGCDDIIEYLIAEHQIDINIRNKEGTTALHMAARFGHLNTVKYLIQQGAHITSNENGETPIHWAKESENTDVVAYLLSVTNDKLPDSSLYEFKDSKQNSKQLPNKNDLNEEDAILNMTPLHVAANENNLHEVKELLNKGAYINVQDLENNTPLFFAVTGHYLEIVKYLIEECKADINAENKKGLTPLHIAAANGFLDIVKYLITMGAVVKMNALGKSPIDFAKDSKHEKIVYYLEKIEKEKQSVSSLCQNSFLNQNRSDLINDLDINQNHLKKSMDD